MISLCFMQIPVLLIEGGYIHNHADIRLDLSLVSSSDLSTAQPLFKTVA